MVSSAPYDQHVATCNATSNNHLPREEKLTFAWAVGCCDSMTARVGNATNRKLQTFEMGNKSDNYKVNRNSREHAGKIEIPELAGISGQRAAAK